MAEVTRRELIQGAIAAGAVLSATNLPAVWAQNGDAKPPAGAANGDPTESKWLDTLPGIDGASVGTTWGTPWPRGKVQSGDPLRVEAIGGGVVPAQTWPIAYWPDGSVKWSAVAVPPAPAGVKGFRVSLGEPHEADPKFGIAVGPSEDKKHIYIGVGPLECQINCSGDVLIESIRRDNKTMLTNGRLVAMSQATPGDDEKPAVPTKYVGRTKVGGVVVEQTDWIRTVVKITGTHVSDAGREWLPFIVRLYFYAGSDVIRVMHSFVFDGDENKDFLTGLGIRFDVPMRDEMHNRHVRFVGQDHGLFYEAVRTITGLRRDPSADARKKQTAGQFTSSNEWATTVSNRLDYIPAWGDFTLSQLSADGFQIKKRTKAGCGWIPAGAGCRAAGAGYIGGSSGGVSFGMRGFWERHPTQLDIRNAATDTATVTMWLYSPEAQPMDLRFYHDLMGMDTYDKQNEGLNITYEDYEPGYGTPYGIARTNELYLRIEPTTPSHASLVAFADVVRQPPTIMASPETILQSGVLGHQWTLPDRSTPARTWIEDKLQGTLDQYLKEIDQRRWYGFWDFGDVMHSYDEDRHQWKYDVGGYAWDNSELSTDLWLWLSVIRTGRADLFRFAEAMCRHTGEVDVYHLGRFKGLGTRHGVQHWADSSKQSRISTPIYRRIYYYLTADERVGDLLTESLHTIEAEKKIVVTRKVKPGSPTLPLPSVEDPPAGGKVVLGALNWGNNIIAWLTQAERTGDAALHKKIVTAMQGVGQLPKGFYTSGWGMDIDTGEVFDKGNPDIELSHLTACFGLPEISNELVDLYGDQAPKYAEAWAQYGRLYGGTDEMRHKELGDFKAGLFKEASLADTHSCITAFAAKLAKDDALAKRAWGELLGRRFSPDAPQAKAVRTVGPDSLVPLEEMPMGTNGAAQWGSAAILCLAMIGDKLN